jgi:hypothetical protein
MISTRIIGLFRGYKDKVFFWVFVNFFAYFRKFNWATCSCRLDRISQQTTAIFKLYIWQNSKVYFFLVSKHFQNQLLCLFI